VPTHPRPPGARGLVRRPPRAYLRAVLKEFLQFLSPRRAYRDLRGFLASRRRYELLFALPAMVLTLLVIVGFYLDSRVERPYKRNIIYAESWPLNRSDAEIHAQQIIDQAKKREAMAAAEKKARVRQEQFKKVDDWLTNRGL
jgi:hypothetical protein